MEDPSKEWREGSRDLSNYKAHTKFSLNLGLGLGSSNSKDTDTLNP